MRGPPTQNPHRSRTAPSGLRLRLRGPRSPAGTPRVRKKDLNGFSLQSEARSGIEVGLLRQEFCPPPARQTPHCGFSFFSRAAAVPAGTAQGFLSPGPGRSFFRVQIQTKKMGGCGVHSVESTLWTRGLGRRLSKAPGPPLPSGGGVAFKAQVTAMEATHRELNLR